MRPKQVVMIVLVALAVITAGSAYYMLCQDNANEAGTGVTVPSTVVEVDIPPCDFYPDSHTPTTEPVVDGYKPDYPAPGPYGYESLREEARRTGQCVEQQPTTSYPPSTAPVYTINTTPPPPTTQVYTDSPFSESLRTEDVRVGDVLCVHHTGVAWNEEVLVVSGPHGDPELSMYFDVVSQGHASKMYISGAGLGPNPRGWWSPVNYTTKGECPAAKG